MEKSQLLCFPGRGCHVTTKSLKVQGVMLEYVSKTSHLGHHISVNNRESIESGALASFWKSFNIFMSDLGHLKSWLKNKLFNQYCCSFYGAPLFNLESNCIHKICCAWRKSLRIIWSLPSMTHNLLITALSGNIPLLLSMYSRFLKFIVKCKNSKNNLLHTVAAIAYCNPMSNSGKNIRMLENKFPSLDATCNKYIMLQEWNSHLENNSTLCETLKELINVRDGYTNIDMFDKEDVLLLINGICTS